MPMRARSTYGRVPRALHPFGHVVDLDLPELEVNRIERPLAHPRRRARIEVDDQKAVLGDSARGDERLARRVAGRRRTAVDGHEHWIPWRIEVRRKLNSPRSTVLPSAAL